MTKQSNILSTKISIPNVRDDFIERYQLMSKIPPLLPSLTLICASSGYGKTTFLLQFLQRLPTPILWYSVDESDNYIARFWKYLMATFVRQDVWKNTPLNDFEPDTESELIEGISALINSIQKIRENKSYILVFEDWHLISNPVIERALNFLLHHCPQNLKLVISSRIDPDLPLTQLRAAGNLLEIREEQLRFSLQEMGEFLRVRFSLALDDESLMMLHHKTEGWITGIQLAAIGLQATSNTSEFMRRFAGTNRYIMDYLLDAAFNQQSSQIKSFLLQTSILEQMTPDLCDAICNIDDSISILSILEQKHLFLVALDDERQWYRYHHLFNDLLSQRLKNSDINIEELHRRASLWYMNMGGLQSSLEFTRLTVYHALHASDGQHLLSILNEIATALWQQNQHDILFEALDALPEESLKQHPTLLFYNAWRFVTSENQHDKVQAQLEQAEYHAIDQNLQGRIASTRATLAIFKNQLEVTIDEAENALSLLGNDDPWYTSASISLGDAYALSGYPAKAAGAYQHALQNTNEMQSILMRLNAGFKLAGVHRQRGRIKEAFSTCNTFLKEAHAHQLQNSAVSGALYGLRGDILSEWLQFDDAKSDIKIGIDCNARRDYIGFYGWVNLYYARLLLAQDNFDDALEHLQMIMQSASLPPWLILPYTLTRIQVWLASGNIHAATTWLNQQGVQDEYQQSPRFDALNLTIARILVTQKKHNEANKLLKHVIRTTQDSHRILSTMIGYIILAISHQLVLREDEAQTALIAALRIGQTGEYLQTFIGGGKDIIPILLKIREGGQYLNYVNYILDAFSDVPQSLIEPLSDRELEILRLIASGMKNQQIADELVISINTVLYHTKNIYGKLDVNRRTQAVQKASKLNLL